MQVRYLNNQIGNDIPPQIKNAVLHCFICGADYSANAGDYFNCPPEQELTCCDEPLSRVIKKEFYEHV